MVSVVEGNLHNNSAVAVQRGLLGLGVRVPQRDLPIPAAKRQRAQNGRPVEVVNAARVLVDTVHLHVIRAPQTDFAVGAGRDDGVQVGYVAAPREPATFMALSEVAGDAAIHLILVALAGQSTIARMPITLVKHESMQNACVVTNQQHLFPGWGDVVSGAGAG